MVPSPKNRNSAFTQRVSDRRVCGGAYRVRSVTCRYIGNRPILCGKAAVEVAVLARFCCSLFSPCYTVISFLFTLVYSRGYCTKKTRCIRIAYVSVTGVCERADKARRIMARKCTIFSCENATSGSVPPVRRSMRWMRWMRWSCRFASRGRTGLGKGGRKFIPSCVPSLSRREGAEWGAAWEQARRPPIRLSLSLTHTHIRHTHTHMRHAHTHTQEPFLLLLFFFLPTTDTESFSAVLASCFDRL